MITDNERRELAKLLRERVGYDIGCVFKELYGDCNSAGPTCGECNERAMLYVADLIEPSEPKVKCVAEIKVDGEHLEKLAHDAAVELTGIDRDALLALADEIKSDTSRVDELQLGIYGSCYLSGIARRIREDLGAE